VNAFGIGGLNVHVVLEEYAVCAAPTSSDAEPLRVQVPDSNREKIAIIGRGVILPKAFAIDDFSRLLRSGESAIIDAPSNRWRRRSGDGLANDVLRGRPLGRGGYIVGYEYDWKTHKIPPKQIAQANPLQFMLLDAARAALAESGYDQKAFDHANTAVVVGNIFGGEFGNHLHVGLRLPEIRRELDAELRAHGISHQLAVQFADEFERRLLQAKPALLDETGAPWRRDFPKRST
jgi:acyl transferase domain-containing protein